MYKIQQIGIPRSIFYYGRGEVFQRFFENLGINVVLSPQTSRSVFQLGKQKVIDEFCFPLKVYAGHVAALASSGIRPIFIPVITGSEDQHSFLCHYQIRLLDIVRDLQLAQEEDLLSSVFTYDQQGYLPDGFFDVGRKLGFSDDTIRKALKLSNYSSTRANSRTQDYSGKTIGLLGRSYVLCDPWVSQDIPHKLSLLGCKIVSEEDLLGKQYYPKEIDLHFMMSARTLDAARQMNAREDIDGILFLLPFNCGPDADIAGKLVAEARKPFLTLVIDELTSEEGLITRLEAFIDVVDQQLIVQ